MGLAGRKKKHSKKHSKTIGIPKSISLRDIPASPSVKLFNSVKVSTKEKSLLAVKIAMMLVKNDETLKKVHRKCKLSISKDKELNLLEEFKLMHARQQELHNQEEPPTTSNVILSEITKWACWSDGEFALRSVLDNVFLYYMGDVEKGRTYFMKRLNSLLGVKHGAKTLHKQEQNS